LFPLFQWHACELAELSACRAKCMTTINMIYIYIYIGTIPLPTTLPATELRCQVPPETVIFLLVLFQRNKLGGKSYLDLFPAQSSDTWLASTMQKFLLPWNPCLHGLCPKKSKFPAFSRGFMDSGVVVWRLYIQKYIL